MSKRSHWKFGVLGNVILQKALYIFLRKRQHLGYNGPFIITSFLLLPHVAKCCPIQFNALSVDVVPQMSYHHSISSRIIIACKTGLVRDLNPGPLAPEARIIPLDQRAIQCVAHRYAVIIKFATDSRFCRLDSDLAAIRQGLELLGSDSTL